MSPNESLLFSIPLTNLEKYTEALVGDRDTPEFAEAHRAVGLSRVMTWVQREPPYAIILWEGPDVTLSLLRTSTTQNKFMGKWRGLVRTFAGPEGAEGVWEPESRHKVFSWWSGEDAPETEARVFHGSDSVSHFVSLLQDIEKDPALMSSYDRVRRSQGISRVEVWHQKVGEDEVVLRLIEGRDLDAAFAAIDEGKNEIDRRFVSVAPHAFDGKRMSQGRSELIVDWRPSH